MAEFPQEGFEGGRGICPRRQAILASGCSAKGPEKGQWLVPLPRAGRSRCGGFECEDLLEQVPRGVPVDDVAWPGDLEAEVAQCACDGGVAAGEVVGS